MNRLFNLDYLRGLTALGIMIYHYLTWTLGKFTADTFLGKVGVYGVSVFYILSGLTLYHVYSSKFNVVQDIIPFAKKRFFRIFPLLWLATLFAILLSHKEIIPYDVFLNFTGLFGFVKWDTAFAAGAWSIGNELVFYAIFPLLILSSKLSKALFYTLSGIITIIFVYFTFFKFDTSIELNEQWHDYTNPLNQAFLFLSGFWIGYLFKSKTISSKIGWSILILGFLLFTLFPVAGDKVNLVTGYQRFAFILASVLICLSLYKIDLRLPQIAHKPLSLLGEASYSVYLLHPIFYDLVGLLNKHYLHQSETIRLGCATLFTFIFSYLVYTYFEKYFMNLGKRF